MKYLQNIRRGLSEPLRHNSPGKLLIVPSKSTQILAVGIYGNAKEAEQKFTTVSHIESGGSCGSKGFGFGTTGKWGVTTLLIILKSGTNQFHP